MLPVFTIVGRPNVGKSTLYNRLTKTRDAIVGDISGITRDRHYGEGKFNNQLFIVVDTGGIGEPEDRDIDQLTQQQVDTAIKEANVILFVVDSKTGIANGDWEIAKLLRLYPEKKIVLVANKSERDADNLLSTEFYALGIKKLFSISAAHGLGLNEMLAELLTDFPVEETESVEIDTQSRTRITVLGRPNVGKSTLINRLFGEERVVVFDQPGTTRDSIEIPYNRQGKKYTLIDTAGIRRRSKVEQGIEIFSVIKAMQAMRQAHVAIVVLDAREGVTEQDMRLIGLVLQSGNALILAFNKWDYMSVDAREHFKNEVDRKLPFVKFARRYYISAQHGTNVGKLFDAIDEIQTALSQSFTTHALTEILMEATAEHQPPLAQGRRVKLRLAHVGSLRPLTFVIHGKQVAKLPGSYKQYLVNYFREKLKLVGIPLIVKLVTDENPYV